MDRLKGFGFEASKLLKNGCEMGLRLIYFGSLKAGSFFVLGLLAFWLWNGEATNLDRGSSNTVVAVNSSTDSAPCL